MPTLTVDGHERSYLLDVPKNLKPGAGLVLVCHGFGGSAEDMRGWAGFSKILDSHNFVFAYPNGLPDAKGKRNFQVEYQFQNPQINDIKFAQLLVTNLVKEYRIDPKRVFCTGMSNGADFSYYLARQIKPFVRAVAPIAGCMMVGWDKTLTTKNRIPIFAVNGTADTTTLWNGDLANRDGWGPYYGTEAVAAHWVKSLNLTERENKTQGQFTRTRWWTKRDSTEFVLCTIDGGGHDWPAHLDNPKRSLAEEILGFFEKHSPTPHTPRRLKSAVGRFMKPTVLVVGSSIFEQWAGVQSAVPGCRVVNRAIGGTITAFWREHLAAVLTEESPDFVLFYCGSNDLNADISSEAIIANVLVCRATLQALVPAAKLAYFGIIKAPQKLGKWEQIEKINTQISQGLPPCDLYVESNAVFFPGDSPIAHFFSEDGLHLTDDAYAVLSAYVQPLLTDWIF